MVIHERAVIDPISRKRLIFFNSRLRTRCRFLCPKRYNSCSDDALDDGDDLDDGNDGDDDMFSIYFVDDILKFVVSIKIVCD